MNDRALPPSAPRRPGLLGLVIAAIVLLISARFIASCFLDYEWWNEVHQIDTWFSLLLYGTLPVTVAALFLFAVFVLSWKFGLNHGGFRRYSRGGWASKLILLGLLALAVLAANATVESWTVVRFFGGLKIPAGTTTYVDPIFHKPLQFYFFDLPFYTALLRLALTASLLSLLIYWVTAHFDELRSSLPAYSPSGVIEFNRLSFGGAFDSKMARILITFLLLALGAEFYFSRYEFLLEDHGQYLLGVDFLADRLVLAFQWVLILCCIVAAALVLLRRGKLALLLLLVLPVRYIIPPIVESIYVRPNELALEKPYIGHHIEATRSAYGLTQRVKEVTLDAKPEIPIDYEKHKLLLDNVRLWDWRAFHDTVSQIQPLRPYAYIDSDVDRYVIGNALRQVLLSPRELDIQQLGEARGRWINSHLIYTHGYGLVMAGSNRITSDGLPQFLIEDAPPKVESPDLQLKQPRLYYGETGQEPVYVGTKQDEFDYPSGGANIHTSYQGTGGFPVSSLATRVAAALTYGDLNVLLTNYLADSSRMMIHRQLIDRLHTLAGFLHWDSDPYIVLSKDGKLVWIVDGYMTSASHPYSRQLEIGGIGSVNYIRNSVKATIDAYTGETHLYVFDPSDPLIQAYGRLFPHLLEPESTMPKDIRAHARYPETLFAAQAEIYRAFHMQDPEAFYNRADLWDLAKTSNSPESSAVKPTYVVATLPGTDTPEFLLISPFTPANKDNLIGMMVARCDGEELGEIMFQQLGKQSIIYGPKQIEAFISQDQMISKDITLWSQQGSEVLRGQILVLPIENSFLYVEPIYIQASGARMPQLKKVALAMGNRLAYADTYEQALKQLIGQNTPGEHPAETAIPAQGPGPGAPQAPVASTQNSAPNESTMQQVREHFRRYRELNAQGKFAEAGQELESIEKLLRK